MPLAPSHSIHYEVNLGEWHHSRFYLPESSLGRYDLGYLFMYLHLCMYIWAFCMHMFMEARHWHWVSSLVTLILWDRLSHSIWRSSLELGSLANELWGYAYLHFLSFPSNERYRREAQCLALTWIWAGPLGFSCLHNWLFTDWAISSAPWICLLRLSLKNQPVN